MVRDLGGGLDPEIIRFVDAHVSSLLAWDIIVYFHKNPDAVVDVSSLARVLGRRAEEVQGEAGHLSGSGILTDAGGILRYASVPEIRREVSRFVDTCSDKSRRLALIALVLHNTNPQSQPPSAS